MLIEEKILEQMRYGSLEWRRNEVYKRLKENCTLDCTFRMLATFDKHALVMTEKGEVYRCHYDDNKPWELIEVKTYSGASQYINEKARSVVDSIMKGFDVSDTLSRFIVNADKIDSP